MTDSAWRQLGNCAEPANGEAGIVDPNIFYPDDLREIKGDPLEHGSIKAARAICEGCVVLGNCLDEGLSGGVRSSIWGGAYFDSRGKMHGADRSIEPLTRDEVRVRLRDRARR